MKTIQKKVTQSFFNKVANEWFERTYDPKGSYLKFPVNRLRKDAALMEIEKLDLKPKMKTMDIGCGTGQLVVDLLYKGFEAYGIDVADKMIQEANKSLVKSRVDKFNQKEIFKVADVEDLNLAKKRYNLITALGLLEYLDTDEELFKVLKNVVVSKGYALVECRNKFFNLFSGNNYTLSICESGQLKGLVNSLSEVEKFSPIADIGIPNIQKLVTASIENFLEESIGKKEWNVSTQKKYTKYPEKMLRRQHTPQELAKTAKKFGFELGYVVYYHLHPYPPKYEKKFPQIYNKISDLMTPLGQTSLGATSASAFIGVLKKNN